MIAYIKINNPREADKAFRQAINLEPKNLEFINNLGILFAMCGMEQEVANIHGRLSELDPKAASVFSTQLRENPLALAMGRKAGI